MSSDFNIFVDCPSRMLLFVAGIVYNQQLWSVKMALKKLILLGIGGLVVLITSVTILANILFPAERIKSYLISELENSLHRTVTIGDIGFTVWSGLGIEVSDLEISDRAAWESDTPFVSLDRFLLTVQFWPLLDRAFIADALILEQPRIFITYNEAGEANYSDLMGSSDTPAAPDTSTGPLNAPMAINLSAIELIDGYVRYRDELTGDDIDLSGINNNVKLAIDRDAHVHADGLLSINQINVDTSGGSIEVGFNIEYQADIDPNAQAVNLDKIALVLGDISLELNGRLTDYAGETPHIDLSVATSDISIERLLAALPDQFRRDLNGATGAGIINISGRINGNVGSEEGPDVNARLTLENGRFESGDLPAPVRDIKSDLELINDRLTVHMVSANIGESDFTARGEADRLFGKKSGKPLIKLDVKSQRMNLDELIPEEEEAVPYTPLPDIELLANANIKEVRVSDLELRDVGAAMAMANQVVNITDITAQAYGGRLSGNVTHDQTDIKNPKLALDIGIEEVSTGEILSPILPIKDILKGSLSTNFAGVTTTDSLGNPLLNALNLLGSLSINNGLVTNWEPLQKMSSWLKGPDISSVNIRSLVGGFRIENGRLQTNRIQLLGDDTEWIVNGSSGLDGSLDYQVQLVFSESLNDKLTNSIASNAVSIFKDEKNRTGIHFKVGGSLTSPDFTWDTGALKKQVRDKVTQEAKKIVADQKNKLMEETGISTASIDTLKTQAASAADSIKSEVGNKAKNVLKGLFRKN